MQYKLDPSSISDPATLALAQDALAAWSQVLQGMVPLGNWLKARIAYVIRGWIGPEWHISHGQIFDPDRPELRTRSWDLIVHCRVPDDHGLPPPATPKGPWVLIPRNLCAVAVDTKVRYETSTSAPPWQATALASRGMACLSQ